MIFCVQRSRSSRCQVQSNCSVFFRFHPWGSNQLGSVNAPLTITVCGILQGNGIAVALLLTDTGGGVIGGIVFVMTGMEHDGDNACFLFFGQSFVFAYNIAVGKEVVPTCKL